MSTTILAPAIEVGRWLLAKPAPLVAYDGKWTGWYLNRYTQYIDYDKTPSVQVDTPHRFYWEAMLMTSGVLYVSAGLTYTCDAWGIGGGGNAVFTSASSMTGAYSGATGMLVGAPLMGNVAVSIGAPEGNTMFGATLVAKGGTTTTGGSSKGGNVNGDAQGRIISRFYDVSKNTEFGRGGKYSNFGDNHPNRGGGGFMDFGYLDSVTNVAGSGYGAGGGVNGAVSSCFSGISGCLLVRIGI